MARDSSPENESLVDFLYLDRNKLASLIGQLPDREMFTSQRGARARGRNSAKGAKFFAEFRLPEDTGELPGESYEQEYEQEYDPFWSHACSFLRRIQSAFAVPVVEAHFGSIVVCTGFLQLVDLRMMRTLLESGVKDDFLAEGLKHIPDSLHATILDQRTRLKYWAALQPQFLTLNRDDLLLKFGAVIDGVWNVIGVLDGLDSPQQPSSVSPLLDQVTTATQRLRDAMGRPAGFLGITPIAICQPLARAGAGEVAGTSRGEANPTSLTPETRAPRVEPVATDSERSALEKPRPVHVGCKGARH